MTTSWSYSHYSLALQCLRKYRYVVVEKIVAEGPDSSDLIFGSALHSALNACLTGEDGLATFQLYWLSYKDKDVEYGRFNWEQLASLGAEFIRKFVKFHAGKYQLEFAEKRLYGSYKGINLEGALDYYGIYQGRASVRDFKTSSRNYESGKEQCALQLYLYAYLYRTNFPGSKIETLGYTVFNKGTGSIQDLTWDFDVVKMFEALDQMVAYANVWDLDGGVAQHPKNYNSCRDYNRKCPYFDKCHGKKETI